MALDEIRRLIQQAVEAAKLAGYLITTDQYGVSPTESLLHPWQCDANCCCPLGALLIFSGKPLEEDRTRTVSVILGVPPGWVVEFTSAFDGITAGLSPYPEAGRLGQEFRKKLVGWEI